MAPLDVINDEGKPSYLQTFTKWCQQLKEGGVDVVMIDVWWGLVEKIAKKYEWQGYEQIFKVMKRSNLKIIPVFSFHQCSGLVTQLIFQFQNLYLKMISNDTLLINLDKPITNTSRFPTIQSNLVIERHSKCTETS